MKHLLIILFASITTIIFAQGTNFEWAKGFGGTSQDDGNSIVVDPAGNVYSTGFFQGTVDFDPGAGTFNLTSAGGNDIFVQKLDPSGNLIWAKSIGGSSGDIGSSISVDAFGNIYISGIFQSTVDFDPGAGVFNLTAVGSNAFLQKLDASGNFIWAKSFGGGSARMTVDAAGNVYTTGYFIGTVDFDPGPGIFNVSSAGNFDVYVQKLDASGNFIWAKSFGGSQFDLGYSVTVDSSGNVYTTGVFQGTADFDPGAGTNDLISAGGFDIFVQKLDVAGNSIWVKAFGGNDQDYSSAIAIDTMNNVYTTGHYSGTADFDPGPGTTNFSSSVASEDIFIQKLDASGNYLWAYSFGGTNDDRGNSVDVDIQGNVYTTGYFEGAVDFDPGAGTSTPPFSTFGTSVFVQKLDSVGNFGWVASFGENNIQSNSIEVEDSTNVYLTGSFIGTEDFDPSVGISNMTSVGSSRDVFIYKMSQCAPNTGIDSQTACNSYTWIDGNTYTASNNTATWTLTNAAGCDSVVTLDLTINNSNTGTDVQTACDSYTWIDGNTYTTSNNSATWTLTNAAGCDSVVTLDLTITNSNTGTDVQTACDSYTWIDGNTYTASNNTATWTLTNAAGCDSIVTLDLTINSVSDVSTSTSGLTITANASGASYQWLDCDNSNTPIIGETGQSFTASANGNYAVEITENGCVDTSACVAITTVGIIENTFNEDFILYPNPTDGLFSIEFKSTQEIITLKIVDASGKLIDSKNFNQIDLIEYELNQPNGIYLIEVSDGRDQRSLIRLIKQ